MELKRYWSRRKWLAALAVIVFGTAIALAVTTIGSLLALSSWLLATWSTVGTNERLQILSFAINGALTVVLVIATCVGAGLTWRMAYEMENSRRLSKRPNLVFHCGRLAVTTGPRHDLMTFSVPMRAVNVGAGAAVHLRSDVTMPREPPSPPNEDWLLLGIRTSLQALPELLEVGGAAQTTVELHVPVFEIPHGRTSEFMRLEAKYEDSEGNLYNLIRTYKVFRHDDLYYLGMAYESLRMTSLSKRWVGDEFGCRPLA